MAAQKSIGITIFTVCCAIYARTAFMAPTKEEMKDSQIAERSRAYGAEEDTEGLVHGVRYYILGIGVIGLFVAIEDHFIDAAKKKKKPNQALEPTTTADTSPAAQETRQP
jgi:hypothetical protein